MLTNLSLNNLTNKAKLVILMGILFFMAMPVFMMSSSASVV